MVHGAETHLWTVLGTLDERSYGPVKLKWLTYKQ